MNYTFKMFKKLALTATEIISQNIGSYDDMTPAIPISPTMAEKLDGR